LDEEIIFNGIRLPNHSCSEIAGMVYGGSDFDMLLFDPHIAWMICVDGYSNDFMFL
jgi:hypothetical protein